MEDIYQNDEHVLNKISQFHCSDSELRLKFSDMNDVQIFRNDRSDYDTKIIIKSRAINPLFLNNNRPTKLSDFDPKWRFIMKNELKPKTYFLKRNPAFLTKKQRS